MLVTIKPIFLRFARKILLHLGNGYRLIEKPKRLFLPSLPRSDISHLDDKFLLLLTQPDSGSEMFAKFMCQSKKVHTLTSLSNSRYMKSTLEEPKLSGILWNPHAYLGRLWNPNCYFNYTSIAGAWASRIAELRQHYPELEYIFEGTPSHVVRYKKLLNIIPNTVMVGSNRNPYVVVSLQKKDLAFLSYGDDEVCRRCIHDWLVRSRYIKDACEKDHIPLVTYERFCEDPYTLIEAFGLSQHALCGKKHRALLKKIKNKNKKDIALSDNQKEIVTAALSKHKELLAYFGYELMH